MKRPLIYVIAGEPSGDLLGARLIAAIKQRRPDAIFKGVGGERMLAAGLGTLFPQKDLAVFGLWEILPKIHLILRRLRETVTAVKADMPDAVVTIDSPDFCFRVARRLRKTGIPLIHYVAPSVWAWRPGRAKKVARFLTHLLALFDFEPPYFTCEKLPCTFVGHPVTENGVEQGDASRFRQRYAIDDQSTVLTVLPGSRLGEVKRMLPLYKDVVGDVIQKHPHVVLVVPTVATVSDVVKEAVAAWPFKCIVVESDADKYDALAASRAALCASGTVNLEVALAHVPMVVTYKISAVTAFLYRAFIRIRLFSPVNIVLQSAVVPECVQENCTRGNITANLLPLIGDSPQRTAQLLLLPSLRAHLQDGAVMPSERAASVVMGYIK